MHRLLCLVFSGALVALVGCKPPQSEVRSVTPAAGSVLTEAPKTIEVEFDRPMNAATINADTFVVTGTESGPFTGAIAPNFEATRFTFTFETAPVVGETVQVSLSDDIESQSSKNLKAFAAEFSVIEVVVPPPPPPPPFLFVDSNPTPESVVERIETLFATFTAAINPLAGTVGAVRITGSRSGARTVELPNILQGPTELEIRSTRSYLPGERVTLTFTRSLTSQAGVALEPLQLEFQVANREGEGDPVAVANGSSAVGAMLHVFDVDSDGREEWVTVAPNGTVELYSIDDPTTPFGTWNIASGARDSVVADFDQDGHPDLVCLATNGLRASLLRGRGDGLGFGPPTSIIWSDGARRRIAVAHADSDGFPDLWIYRADDPARATRVHFGAATSPFSRSTSRPNIDPSSDIATGDFDGDGLFDLVYVDRAGVLTSAWAVGDGTFTLTTHGNPPSSFVTVHVGNFDGNDLVDFVTSNRTGLTDLWLANGQRTWTAKSVGSANGTATVIDYDADGALDLLSPDFSNSTFEVRYGIGDGNFSSIQPLDVRTAMERLVVGDVRGNGVLEVIGVDSRGDWWIGERTPTGLVDRVFVPNFAVPADGGPSVFTVRADHEYDLDGFTIALTFDPDVLTIDSIGTADTDAGLAGVELEIPNIDPTTGEVIVAVLFDFLPPFSGAALLAGADQSLLAGEARLSNLPAAVATTTLVPAHGIGSPATDTVFVVDGQSLTPALEPGVVSIAGSGGGGIVVPPPTPSATFLRGDADGDGVLGLSDGTRIQSYLGGTAPAPLCLDAADANDDGTIDVTDAVRIYDYLFGAGSPPAAPFPTAGSDPTADDLGCDG